MARLTRFLFLAVLAVAVWAPLSASASVPKTVRWYANYGGIEYYGSSGVEACTAAGAARGDPFVGIEGQYCRYRDAGYGVYGRADYCAAGTVVNGDGTCDCSPPLVESGDKCVQPGDTGSTCTAGSSSTLNVGIGWGRYSSGSSGTYAVDGGGSVSIVGSLSTVPSTVCSGGCSYSGGDWVGNVNMDTASNGYNQVVAATNYVATGATCTGGDTDITGEAAPPCDGTVGTVNGKSVCVSSNTNNSSGVGSTTTTTGTSTSTTVTNADGSKTTTTVGTSTNSSGGTSTTTTTTTTKPDGTTTTSTSTTSDNSQESACQKNPSAAGCGGNAVSVSKSELYTAKDKTVASVLANASSVLKGSGLGGSMAGFFTVSGSGSCPVWVWNVPYFNNTVTVDAYCVQWALNAYALIRVVVLLVASFIAFRIAVE